MTPDEMQCTTCEGEGAVAFAFSFMRFFVPPGCIQPKPGTYTLHPYEVDFCPECGRGGEVGRL